MDALLVTHQVNVRYLTGFTGSSGALLVTADGAVLFTDGRYATQAQDEAADVDHDIGRGELVERAWRAAAQRGVRQLGFEADRVDWTRGEALRGGAPDERHVAVPAPGHVEALRQVKDAHELALLERACALSDAAFEALLEHLRPGLTERHVARFLDRTGEDLGADGPSFDTIVASGPNGARPHHRPGDRRLQAGDLVTCDFGALVDGYHADTTRTVALGTPPDRLREVHEVVREAQQAGVDAVRAGATVGAVDAAARGRIEAAGFGDAFVHPTGHALGLEIHEAPIVAAGAAATLDPGTAITVEPGVYLPGTGGVRIEDTVVVATDGPARRLTTSPRDLLVL